MYFVISIYIIVIATITITILINLIVSTASHPIPKHIIRTSVNEVTDFYLENQNESIPKIFHKVIIVDSMEIPTLDSLMDNAIRSWTDKNPDYTMKIYSGNDCIDYIKKYFSHDNRILNTYNKLAPYGFKCDFFRYLVLYNEGGIYCDARMICLENLSTFISNKKWISFIDNNGKYIINGFIASTARHPYLTTTIENIIKNCELEYYGKNVFYTTGPSLLWDSISLNIFDKKIKKFQHFGNIIYKDKIPYLPYNDKNIIQVKYKKNNNVMFDVGEWEKTGVGNSSSYGNNYLYMYNQKLVYVPNRPISLYISLSSIPSRCQKMLDFIEANMTIFPLDSIIEINIPKKFNRTEELYPILVSNNKRIKIYQVDIDYGPITKILPSLYRHQHENACIISIDDDQIYPLHYLENLYQYAKKDNFSSILSYYQDQFYTLKNNVVGHGGVAYMTKLINVEELFKTYEFFSNEKRCVNSDNLIISYYLNKNNIPIKYPNLTIKGQKDNKDLQYDSLKDLKTTNSHHENYNYCMSLVK